MFILQRQEVELASVRHPKYDRQIPILTYQGQPFRLVHIFPSDQEPQAKAFWRDLVDKKGKLCVLLLEADRYSIWKKVRVKSSVSLVGSSQSATQS